MADGSNSFLNISSHSGSIDVYVGDGASAEIHTKEGKREGKTFLQVSFSFMLFPNFSVIRRSSVCACSLLAASWRGAQWSVGGN